MEIVEAMLTDTKLRNLKPLDNLFKVIDRDGLYVSYLLPIPQRARPVCGLPR
jgi:hypothetical protein